MALVFRALSGTRQKFLTHPDPYRLRDNNRMDTRQGKPMKQHRRPKTLNEKRAAYIAADHGVIIRARAKSLPDSFSDLKRSKGRKPRKNF